jgi:hypothetical protein
VAAPSTDVGTTGSSSEGVPQPGPTAPEDWSQNGYVQIEGGFLGGLALGFIPFAGAGQQLLDATGVLPHGTLPLLEAQANAVPGEASTCACSLILGGAISRLHMSGTALGRAGGYLMLNVSGSA